MDGDSPVGWLSLLPPLLTIFLAIVTRRVVFSLLLGIASAVLIMLPSPAAVRAGSASDFSWIGYVSQLPRGFISSLTEGHLWPALADKEHLRVFAFTILLGMQVAVIHRAGGMQGIVAWAAPVARNRRGGQVLTWLLGLVIFIDDYANTLLLGSTMRPLTDRLRISREKLAFLVDSTAAPVSGLALISTWIATEISTMEAGYINAGVDIGSATFGIFIQTIPSRFYVIYMLLFVFLNAWMCRDFGPMLTAEQNAGEATGLIKSEPMALATGLKATNVPVLTPEANAYGSQNNAFLSGQAATLPAVTEERAQQTVPPRAINAMLPIAVTVGVVLWLLVVTGRAALGPEEVVEPTLEGWGQVIGQGSSYLALLYGAAAGLLVVLGLAWYQRCIGTGELRTALLDGFLHVLPALIILWLAWTLSHLTGNEEMRTGAFIATQISEFNLAPGLLPTIVFLLASVIAFSTGTSWGTMAIVMPIIIPLVYGLLAGQLGETPAADHPLLLASIGSVLAGAIFGDHCSPISDTTILSSRSSSCDHIAHVRTQMPYALTVAGVAVVCGTLPAGFGVSSWLLLPVGLLALVLVLMTCGRRVP